MSEIKLKIVILFFFISIVCNNKQIKRVSVKNKQILKKRKKKIVRKMEKNKFRQEKTKIQKIV